MEKNRPDKEFEDYWKIHRSRLVKQAPSWLAEERQRSLGMNTMGDWILLPLPIVAMLWLLGNPIVESEMLNFIIVLAVGVVVTVVCQMLKPYVTGKRSVSDIDNDIKQYFYQRYLEERKAAD